MRICLIWMSLLVFWLANTSFYYTGKGTLRVELENVKSSQGTIWMGIYSSEQHFMVKEKAIVVGFQVSKTGTLNFQVPNLPYGKYAFAIFHDLNGNNELDFNVLGIPQEPFAFSKKPVSRFRQPKFEEVNFDFKSPEQLVRTKLERLL